MSDKFQVPISFGGELSGTLYPEAAEKLGSLPSYGISRYTPENVQSDGVAIVSGGMDSVTLVYYLIAIHGAKPHLVSFDYGQRHKKELDFALRTAERLGLHWSLVDLTSITDLIASSALTSPDVPVPEGHYAEDNMAITVVPNRNMTMLSIATAIAVSNKYHYVALGIHAGDHAQYPDCRATFMNSCSATAMLANEGFIQQDFEVLAPFIGWSKADIAAWAFDLAVPLELTWSCYKGGEAHCGRCATCVERLEAIEQASEERRTVSAAWDKTIYEDSTSWRQIVADFKTSHTEP